MCCRCSIIFFFFQAEDGIRDDLVTGVQTCALPISKGFDRRLRRSAARAWAGQPERLNSRTRWVRARGLWRGPVLNWEGGGGGKRGGIGGGPVLLKKKKKEHRTMNIMIEWRVMT